MERLSRPSSEDAALRCGSEQSSLNRARGRGFPRQSCQQAHPFLLHDQCGQDRGHAGATRGGRAEQDAVTGKPMSVSCLMSRFMIQASSCLPDVFMPWNGARARGSVSHISTTFF